jgi:hypothetical protein
MDPDIFYLIALIIFLSLDLLTSAARSALINTNLARLLSQRDEMVYQVHRTTALLSNIPRTQASLNLFQSFLRFLIAGLSLQALLSCCLSPGEPIHIWWQYRSAR